MENAAAAVHLVTENLGIDDDAAQRLVTGCLAVDKTVTGPEIVELARTKLTAARQQIKTGKIASVVGLLIKHVPKMCTGATLHEARQTVQRNAELERERRESHLTYHREHWHEYSEEGRAETLAQFPELAETVRAASPGGHSDA
jgi:hypothetical protein